ncbi:MAG: family 16 glycoside hydrolase, partial [Cyanobacteria bacterium J06649_11]
NQVRLKVTDGEVGHYLNEILVANYPNTGEAWEAMVAKSKFKDMENFGKTTSGKIGLQDHGDGVWFRNVKIREVKR